MVYKTVALYYNISVKELIHRLVNKGEPIISNYYKEVNSDGF